MFTYAAKLIEVVDGDTVDLLIDLRFGVHVKERCRLYGIDAPEMPTMALVATQHKTKTIPAGFCRRVCVRGSSLNTCRDVFGMEPSCYGTN